LPFERYGFRNTLYTHQSKGFTVIVDNHHR
jgi:hypothetical protein